LLSFPWPLLEEARSIFKVALFCKKSFEKELKTNDIAIKAESQAL
jgi:hypothetical protein